MQVRDRLAVIEGGGGERVTQQPEPTDGQPTSGGRREEGNAGRSGAAHSFAPHAHPTRPPAGVWTSETLIPAVKLLSVRERAESCGAAAGDPRLSVCLPGLSDAELGSCLLSGRSDKRSLFTAELMEINNGNNAGVCGAGPSAGVGAPTRNDARVTPGRGGGEKKRRLRTRLHFTNKRVTSDRPAAPAPFFSAAFAHENGPRLLLFVCIA